MRNTNKSLYARAVELVAICPYCWQKHDCASIVNDVKAAAPKPEDLSCCHRCGEFSAFDDQLELIPLTEAMLETLPPTARLDLMEARLALKRGFR